MRFQFLRRDVADVRKRFPWASRSLAANVLSNIVPTFLRCVIQYTNGL
jgi:hypothetical protein